MKIELRGYAPYSCIRMLETKLRSVGHVSIQVWAIGAGEASDGMLRFGGVFQVNDGEWHSLRAVIAAVRASWPPSAYIDTLRNADTNREIGVLSEEQEMEIARAKGRTAMGPAAAAGLQMTV